ncbi:fatty acid/sphingolipid desaturase [Thozetella sp. PMI_491]|nr:fatty acid/sphingolipid desaturase [Thozetella sp. PMI_491]
MDEKKLRVLSRREVEALIAEDRKVFILDQFVIKADAWIPYHPGGEKAILHMVGRDATDEVTALHSAKTKQGMMRYRIGRIEGRWENFIPPLQGGRFRMAVDDVDTIYNPETIPLVPAGRQGSPDSSQGFDSDSSTCRSRGTRAASSGPSSAPSVASVKEDDDGMAHLDSVTREKIALDLETYPAVDAATQDTIVAKYRRLDARIRAEGLYECRYESYAVESCRYVSLFALSMLFLHVGWYVVSAVCLGAMWQQLAFTAHDAGHMGITHNFNIDSLIGILVADFAGGLSIGWWKRNHNIHHIVTNSPEHDPDIEYLPLLAVSHRFFANLRSTYYEQLMEYDAVAQFAIRFQKYSFYPLMLLGRFNLYALSWGYLLQGQRSRRGPGWWHWYLEIAGQAFFWYWYGYALVYKSIPNLWSRVAFVLVSHMVQAPLHVQLTLSHFAMSTADLGPQESFPQRMLRTTMDVDCPQWLDFFHGGLQFQSIHHLYPRIPRHNLRRAQKLVQEFCNDVGIPYALYGFVDGNKQVIGALSEVSRQAAILAKCQRTIASQGNVSH